MQRTAVRDYNAAKKHLPTNPYAISDKDYILYEDGPVKPTQPPPLETMQLQRGMLGHAELEEKKAVVSGREENQPAPSRQDLLVKKLYASVTSGESSKM